MTAVLLNENFSQYFTGLAPTLCCTKCLSSEHYSFYMSNAQTKSTGFCVLYLTASESDLIF